MTTPQLRMGLIGFDNEAHLLALLRTRCAMLRWEPAAPPEADALWVNGERALGIGDGLVRIHGGAARPATTIDLRSMERPTLFALPLADPALRPPSTFDLRSAASVDRALRRLELVLQPVVMQLALAHEIAERLHALTARAYRLVRKGRLAALVNVGGGVAIDLKLTPSHLREAAWEPLPGLACDLPPGFLGTNFAEVLWLYVGRAETDLLPRRYRSALLHFRAIPRVPQRLIRDVHYAVLSELGAEPQDFPRLRHAVGLSEDALARALAALYFAGSVTTNPQRAARGAALPLADAGTATELRQSMFPAADLSQPLGPMAAQARATVPAPLEHGERDERR